MAQAATAAADQLGEELGLEVTRAKTEAMEAAAARDKLRLKKEISSMQHSLNLLTSIQKAAQSVEEHQRAEQQAISTAQQLHAAHEQLGENSVMAEVTATRTAAFALEANAPLFSGPF